LHGSVDLGTKIKSLTRRGSKKEKTSTNIQGRSRGFGRSSGMESDQWGSKGTREKFRPAIWDYRVKPP